MINNNLRLNYRDLKKICDFPRCMTALETHESSSSTGMNLRKVEQSAANLARGLGENLVYKAVTGKYYPSEEPKDRPLGTTKSTQIGGFSCGVSKAIPGSLFRYRTEKRSRLWAKV